MHHIITLVAVLLPLILPPPMRPGAAVESDLPFQGSYSQVKVAEPVYGGHGTAMGPPPAIFGARPLPTLRGLADTVRGGRPASRRRRSAAAARKITFSNPAAAAWRCSTTTVTGWLDIYIITAFELSEQRERIPHRNALFRNLGDWKFQDVSAGSGLDVAAWGNGVCAGDYDDDGRLDLYVTNFGPNFLFRNNGDGTFCRARGPGRCAGARLDHRCTFFDADGDGDLISTSRGMCARAGASWPRAQRDAHLARRAKDDGGAEGAAW